MSAGVGAFGAASENTRFQFILNDQKPELFTLTTPQQRKPVANKQIISIPPKERKAA
jgi:hypothetical protein